MKLTDLPTNTGQKFDKLKINNKIIRELGN
jgi:hypothetical protein